MMRKGLSKGSGMPGYYNLAPMDSHIHALSAKGVKSYSHQLHAKDVTKKPSTRDLQRWVNLSADCSDYITIKDLEEAEKIIQDEITEIGEHNVDYVGKREGWLSIKTAGEEWVIAPNEDEAEKVAKEVVQEDLDENPDLFNKEFMESHINTDHLRDELESDVSNSNYDYYHDIADESTRDQYENRQISELVEGGYLDHDEYEKADDAGKEKLVDDAIEDAVEKKTEEELSDPMEYLEQIYGKEEAVKEAIRIGGIDEDEAVEDAINQDGWAHFLNHYDGNYETLKSGKVLFRVE